MGIQRGSMSASYRILHCPNRDQDINLLKPKTYFMYQQLSHSEILCSAHSAFMCFAWI